MGRRKQTLKEREKEADMVTLACHLNTGMLKIALKSRQAWTTL